MGNVDTHVAADFEQDIDAGKIVTAEEDNPTNKNYPRDLYVNTDFIRSLCARTAGPIRAGKTPFDSDRPWQDHGEVFG